MDNLFLVFHYYCFYRDVFDDFFDVVAIVVDFPMKTNFFLVLCLQHLMMNFHPPELVVQFLSFPVSTGALIGMSLELLLPGRRAA